MDKNQNITTEAEARQYAIDWQNWAINQNLSYGELVEWQAVFEKLADTYPNLKDEFKENGLL